MTTLGEESFACSMCGQISCFMVVHSTNQLGSSDLDGRPAEMARSTLRYNVQVCPHCGFVGPVISAKTPISKDFLRSPKYQAQLNDRCNPPLVNAFLCFALILESLGELGPASKACLRAAWACDDSHKFTQATECRRRCLALREQALRAKGEDVEEPIEARMVAIDIVRRAGDFERACALSEEGLSKLATLSGIGGSDTGYRSDALPRTSQKHLRKEAVEREWQRRILQFQLERSREKDDGCYTADAV